MHVETVSVEWFMYTSGRMHTHARARTHGYTAVTVGSYSSDFHFSLLKGLSSVQERCKTAYM